WPAERVTRGLAAASPDGFYRLQAVVFAVLDVIARSVGTTPVRRSSTPRKAPRHPGPPALHQFAPLRAEARQAIDLLRDAPEQRWTLRELAAAVHLSPPQLGRVFVVAYGRTQLTYPSTLRAGRLARLPRATALPAEAPMRQLGGPRPVIGS